MRKLLVILELIISNFEILLQRFTLTNIFNALSGLYFRHLTDYGFFLQNAICGK